MRTEKKSCRKTVRMEPSASQRKRKPVLPNLSLALRASNIGGHKGVYLQPHNLCYLVRTSISDQYRLSIEVIFDVRLGDTHIMRSIPEKYVQISGLGHGLVCLKFFVCLRICEKIGWCKTERTREGYGKMKDGERCARSGGSADDLFIIHSINISEQL